MYRNLAKVLAWVLVVGMTCYLNRSNEVMMWITTILMAGWSISVLDKDWALRGDEKNPSILWSATFVLPLFGIALLVGVPSILHDLGYHDSWSFDWVVAISAFFTGLMLAAYLWIPFLLYALVDLLFNRFAGRRTGVPVT